MRKLKVTEIERLTAVEYQKCIKKPLVVVLDNVRSMNNTGSVFRTADAFRVECIYLCGITGVPPNAEIHKTALGAEDTVDWYYFSDTLSAIKYLKKHGYIVCALEQTDESIPINLFKMQCGEKYALVIGHEVKGVQQEVINECAFCLEIPQYGTKHSLNVSVAAGIALFHLCN